MRHVETMSGRGTITAGTGEPVMVDYELHVLLDEIYAGPDSPPIPGMKDIQGIIQPVRFFGENGLLLEMQDGRKLRFSFRDTNGSIALNEWIGP